MLSIIKKIFIDREVRKYPNFKQMARLKISFINLYLFVFFIQNIYELFKAFFRSCSGQKKLIYFPNP